MSKQSLYIYRQTLPSASNESSLRWNRMWESGMEPAYFGPSSEKVLAAFKRIGSSCTVAIYNSMSCNWNMLRIYDRASSPSMFSTMERLLLYLNLTLATRPCLWKSTHSFLSEFSSPSCLSGCSQYGLPRNSRWTLFRTLWKI